MCLISYQKIELRRIFYFKKTKILSITVAFGGQKVKKNKAYRFPWDEIECS